MRIKHQWLSTHNFSAVVVPTGSLNIDRNDKSDRASFELEQRDGSVIKVQYNDHFTFPLADLPDAFTKVLFGIDKDRMRSNILRAYPDFARLEASQQKINYMIVNRV
jgi:hypothetical protein